VEPRENSSRPSSGESFYFAILLIAKQWFLLPIEGETNG